MTDQEKPVASVQTLDRALKIIELLALHGEGFGVTEIGQRVGLHKSTVHRLLNHLLQQGYIEKDPIRAVYKLGLKFIELASLRLNHVEIKTEAAPFLHQLASRLDLAVHLAILVDSDAVYIEKIEPRAHLRMYSQIGKRIPVYCSALGKSLVSELGPDKLVELSQSLVFEQFTNTTIMTREKFLADVALTKERGWGLDDEEHESGIRCIGAPVRDFTGRIVASLSASGSSILPSMDTAIAQQVIETAQAVSRRLGWIKH